MNNRLGKACRRAALAALLLAVALPGRAADTPAKVVKQAPPDYPQKALDRGQEGWVELEFMVGTDGRVKNVSVVKAEPMRVFEGAAVKAVQKWEFEPAVRNGAPVESQERRKLSFKL